MFKIGGILFRFILLGCITQAGIAASSKDIIDGFSEFIIERADANLVAVFERRLKNDENFQCYFPNTYEKIDHIQLKNLFASKSYWEEGLNEDLSILAYRTLLGESQRSLKFFHSKKVQQFLDLDKAIETLGYFVYVKNGESYELGVIDLQDSSSLQKEINGFSYSFASLAESVKKINPGIPQADACAIESGDVDQLRDMLRGYVDASSHLISWLNHLEQYGRNLRLSRAGKEALYCRANDLADEDCPLSESDEFALIDGILKQEIPQELYLAALIANRINKAFTVLEGFVQKEIDSIGEMIALLPALQGPQFDQTSIQKVSGWLEEAKEITRQKLSGWRDERRQKMIRALTEIKQKVDEKDVEARQVLAGLRTFINSRNLQSYSDRALLSLEVLEDSSRLSDASYARLRNSVMFFASIADATDKLGVKSILETYTLPPVSYAEKRKQGEGVFISSYIGLAGTDFDDRGSSEEVSGNGLFAPLGVEFNYGFDNGGSWSVMLSPVDFAFPVNLKLNGIEDEVEFDELIAPSISLSYGFEDYPLAAGVGYQKGRTFNDVNKAEDGFLLFLVLDMPLFRFY